MAFAFIGLVAQTFARFSASFCFSPSLNESTATRSLCLSSSIDQSGRIFFFVMLEKAKLVTLHLYY